MSKTDLTTYLNDHHAGSLGAIELVDHLIEAFAGEPLANFFKDLRGEIKTDQNTLEELMARIDAEESAIKKAGAWVAEKLSRMKLRVSGHSTRQLGYLQALEALMLGITGKRALWSALAAAAEDAPELRFLDYAKLMERATEQRDRVEAKRRESAREVLGNACRATRAPVAPAG